MDDRLENTLAVAEKIKNSGYDLIEMWECEFNRQIIENEELKKFLKDECDEIIRMKPLNPRHAFFGGKTCNNVKIFDCNDHQRVRYVVVCSLYPYINKREKYIIGHPKNFIGQDECSQIVGENFDISRVDGLILCNVLPPRNLYHGILPV